MTYIFHIPYPEDIDKEDFSGLFNALELEGIEEGELHLSIYITEQGVEEAEPYIKEVCDNFDTSYEKTILENKNWNEQWERSFQPLLIDDFVLVRATFHPENRAVEHEIIIEPKMSFGTGHHPTTAQMMQQMRLLDFKGKKVLDCGSGTGILAVLAEKMGASSCIALDNDTWCYENCRENIVLNSASVVQPVLGEINQFLGDTFDSVLANIHRNFLLEYMDVLASILKKDGCLLISGFYSEDAKLILDKAMSYGLSATYRTSSNNWDCILLKKSSE